MKPLISLAFLVCITVCGDKSSPSAVTPRPENRTPYARSASVLAPQAASTIRGRIVYADTDNPVRRAEVALFGVDTATWEAEAATDAYGKFVFEGVVAGRYIVVADAPDIVSPRDLISRRSSFGDAIRLGTISDGFAEVSVEGGRTASIEIHVRRGGAITGRVTNAEGEPLADLDMRLFVRRDGELVPFDRTWNALDADKKLLQTDSRGIYRIGGLPPGEYIVRATDARIATDGRTSDENVGAYDDGSLVVAYHPGATRLADAVPVTVHVSAEASGIDVLMPHRLTHKIAGIVRLKKGGNTLGGAEIKIDRKDEGARITSSLDYRTRTDEGGRWRADGIPDGEYIVTIRGSFAAAYDKTNNRQRSLGVAPQTQVVRVRGEDVFLESAMTVGAKISGTLVTGEGTPPRSGLVRVDVVPAMKMGDGSTAAPRHESRSLAGESVSDDADAGFTFVRDDGRFEIRELPAGAFFLRISGLVSGRHYVKAITRGTTDLLRAPLELAEAGSAEGIRVTLGSDFVMLSGEVTRGSLTAHKTLATANPVIALAPVEPSCRLANAPVFARTDERGRFQVKAAPGEYFIFGFAPQSGGRAALDFDDDFFREHRARLQRVVLRQGDPRRFVKAVRLLQQ